MLPFVAILNDQPPAYANVLNIEIGMSSFHKLERKVGPAKPYIGTHSDSGREWHWHGLHIVTDQDRPPVISWITISPHSTRDPWVFNSGPLSKLRWGMTLNQARSIIPDLQEKRRDSRGKSTYSLQLTFDPRLSAVDVDCYSD